MRALTTERGAVLEILVSPATGYYRGVEFCNRFDEALARSGPPGVFLVDHKGRLRFDPSWTRDVWQRAVDSPDNSWRWALLRDRSSGFVMLALITSSNLVLEHPRMDVRLYGTQDEAEKARACFGTPPIASEAW